MPDVFSAAAEPNRRRLLQLLASGPRTVSELAAEFPVTRSAISQHLALLAEVGLVTNRKQGRQRFYEVLPSGMSQLRAEIDRFWTNELDQLVADASASRFTNDPTTQRPNDPTTPRNPEEPRGTPMTAEKTVVLPVSPDEAFASTRATSTSRRRARTSPSAS